MALHMPPEKLFQQLVGIFVNTHTNVYMRLINNAFRSMCLSSYQCCLFLYVLDAPCTGLPGESESLRAEGRAHVSGSPGWGLCWPHPHKVSYSTQTDIRTAFMTVCDFVLGRKWPQSMWKMSLITTPVIYMGLASWMLLYLCARLLSSMLQTVCQSLSDSNQVVRSAGLFALGQFSEHLQVSFMHAHLALWSTV